MSVLLAGLAAGALVFGLVRFVPSVSRTGTIRRRVVDYVEPRQVVAIAATPGWRGRLAGPFAYTERRLARTRLWRACERLVESAGLPLRTVELFYAAVGGAILVLLLAAAAGLPLPAAILLLVLAAVAGRFALGMRISRRLAAFEEQLPDLLAALASALRAGHSFTQALQAVADEADAPAKPELQRVLAEARLGRPIDDALAGLGRRMRSEDLEFVLTAISIQRQVGGSVAGLFTTVSETVRQRQQFVRKLRGLTAMGRASAAVLIAVPLVLGALLTLLNSSYMSPLYTTSTGIALLVAAAISIAIGAVWLRKIVGFRG